MDDQEKGISYNESSESKNLLVSFGGINQGIGIPVFEFYKSLEKINCNKIFIRDFNQSWYHLGADKQVDTLESLQKFLEEEKIKNNYEKICFIGNSMGGYAAILFGVLLNVDKVISFSPQTFIDKKNRLINFDFRWRKQIKKTYKEAKNIEYFDLKKVLDKIKYNTTIEIHYSTNHRLDKRHSERLKDNFNITLRSYKEGGHNVVKEIKNKGNLNQLLKKAFN